jgi:hypothetical protein
MGVPRTLSPELFLASVPKPVGDNLDGIRFHKFVDDQPPEKGQYAQKQNQPSEHHSSDMPSIRGIASITEEIREHGEPCPNNA